MRCRATFAVARATSSSSRRRSCSREAAMNDHVRAVGASPPRLDAGDKATGRADYADDIRLPGMLHAAVLTSPHAHARILGYRVDAARAIPGVKAIITGADLSGPRSGGIIKDESMVARGKVRYVGEPVAAVAAV